LKHVLAVLLFIPIFLFSFQLVSKADDTKQVMTDKSVYYIIVDRFYNGDRSNDIQVNTQDPLAYHGGDIKGIIKRINHIKKMGFTTILLSSIFESGDDDYLSEDVKDYYKINPHFGNIDDIKELVRVAHDIHIQIILDLPISQDGSMDEIAKAANWWIEEVGVDGFFLKKHLEIPIAEYDKFAHEVKAVNEHVYIILQIDDGTIDLENSSIDCVVNGDLTVHMRAVLNKPDQSIKPLLNAMEGKAFWKYIDDPNIRRFTYEIVQQNQFPGERWPLILTFLYTTPGVPAIFYGTEIALNGGEGAENHRLMDFRADDELIEFMEKLGNIRNHYPSLTDGDLNLLYEEGGMAVYANTYKDETTIVALNNSSQNQTVEISSDLIAPNKQLFGLFEGELIKEKNGTYVIQINQEQAEIFVVQNHTGINMMNVTVMTMIPIVFMFFYYFLWKRGKKSSY
jgi:hypothetical protein